MTKEKDHGAIEADQNVPATKGGAKEKIFMMASERWEKAYRRTCDLAGRKVKILPREHEIYSQSIIPSDHVIIETVDHGDELVFIQTKVHRDALREIKPAKPFTASSKGAGRTKCADSTMEGQTNSPPDYFKKIRVVWSFKYPSIAEEFLIIVKASSQQSKTLADNQVLVEVVDEREPPLQMPVFASALEPLGRKDAVRAQQKKSAIDRARQAARTRSVLVTQAESVEGGPFATAQAAQTESDQIVPVESAERDSFATASSTEADENASSDS